MNAENTYEKGSFLIELLVAFAIISISMSVVVNSFVTSQHAYYTTSNKADLVSSLAFLLEDMTREARVSTGFTCAAPPCIAMTDFDMEHIEGLNGAGAGELITYSWAGVGSPIQKTDPVGVVSDMVPSGVMIDNFEVTVLGTTPTDPIRARVSLSAHSIESPEQVIHLQTSYTSRSY